MHCWAIDLGGYNQKSIFKVLISSRRTLGKRVMTIINFFLIQIPVSRMDHVICLLITLFLLNDQGLTCLDTITKALLDPLAYKLYLAICGRYRTLIRKLMLPVERG